MSARRFSLPAVFFAYRNGEPRIVIDGAPWDPRYVSAENMERFAAVASRTSLRKYCEWNDRNGEFADATEAELREIVRSMERGE